MRPQKIIAFFLVLLSLAAIVLVGMAALGFPSLHAKDPMPLPPGVSPGCFSVIFFVMLTPITALPGLAGIYLWRSARNQEAGEEREAAVLPERERLFQARLDDLARRMVRSGGEASAIPEEVLGWTRDFDEPRRRRLLGLLAEWGFGPPGDSGATVRAARTGSDSASGCARAFGVALFLFAGISLVWIPLCMFILLGTQAGRMMGNLLTPEEVLAVAPGCVGPGVTALIGGLAFRWLLRQEQHRQQRIETFLDRVRETAMQGCLARVSQQERPVRFARADVVTTLPELDGARKGNLIARLHSEGLLPRLSLGAIDLRNAVLSGTDLSGADLSGADLSGAVLYGASLAGAVLSRSRLCNADLRTADATKADLSQADLSRARLQRCILRRADLREANLEGATLWQADLQGANYAGARLSHEQLRGALSV